MGQIAKQKEHKMAETGLEAIYDTATMPATTPVAETPAAPAVEVAEPAKGTTLLTNEEVAEDGDKTLLGKESKEESDADADKTKAADAKDKSVPEKYEVKVPEGMSIDNTMLDTMTPVFKDMGLTGEQVQKLVDAYAPLVQSQVKVQQEAAIKEWQNTTNTWKEETKKTLGPDVAKEMSFAAKAIEKSGVKGLRELVDETGVGNALPLVQFFIWAGKQFSSDNFVDGSNRGVKDGGSLIDIYDHPTSKSTLK